MKRLHQFCAPEIRILLGKIEEDYDGMYDNSVWYHLLKNQTHMTRVERFCVNRAVKTARKNHGRNKYLAAIISQQMNPKTHDLAVDGFMEYGQAVQGLYNQIAASQGHTRPEQMAQVAKRL